MKLKLSDMILRIDTHYTHKKTQYMKKEIRFKVKKKIQSGF